MLDSKQELKSIKEAMPSTGKTDCTSMVVYFEMLSNLRYYDLPGAGGLNESYENINRAALLLKQIDDEDEGLKPVGKFEVWNCSDYPRTKQIKKKTVTVKDWQSPENQRYVNPDIILYVVAPNRQFVREDRKYLKGLLRERKNRDTKNKIIFALNLFQKDGIPLYTEAQIEDCRKNITQVYQEFYPDQEPFITEVDCKTGTGIQQITEVMCQILPDNKIGKMGQALSDELREIAKKERSRRYRQALIYIASRLTTYKVDEKLGKNDIQEEAYAAVCDYAIRVFREEDILAEAEKQWREAVENLASEAKISREKAVKILVDSVEAEEVTEEQIVGYKPEYKDVETEEDIPVSVETTEKVKRSAIARGALGAVEGTVHLVTIPLTGIFSVGQKIFGVKDEDLAINQVHNSIQKQFEADYYRNETVIKMTTKKVKRVEQKMVGMEAVRDNVTKMVPKIVQKEQEVGKDYLQGGYPIVENLLAIGLGIESADPDQDIQKHFEEIVEDGRIQVQGLLGPYQDTINQLAENQNPQIAENKIITILERALLK
ncbi:MAG: hypothetical protein ACR9NN_10655 [Nostochopsis sp.]